MATGTVVAEAVKTPMAAAAGAWVGPLGVAGGVVADVGVNLLATVLDRSDDAARAARELLVNQDLARVQAQAIEHRLQGLVASGYGDAALGAVATAAPEWWVRLVETEVTAIQTVSETAIVTAISQELTERASVGPTSAEWTHVLSVATGFVPRAGPILPSVLERAAEALAAHFVHDCVLALKADAAVDGRAFASVVLRFFATIVVGIDDLRQSTAAIASDTADLRVWLETALPTVVRSAQALGLHEVAQALRLRLTALEHHIDRAFASAETQHQRRHDELLQRIGHGSSTPPHQLPSRPLAGQLFGRESLRLQLARRLRDRRHTYVVGPAGFGKTGLAAEALRDVVGESLDELAHSPYPDGVVLLNLYELKRLDEAWMHLVRSFRGGERPDRAAKDLARRARAGKRALVVVEGAETVREQLGTLLSVLPPGDAVRLVLTRDPGQAVPGQSLSVDAELSASESLALLHACAPHVPDVVLQRVHTHVGGHPLALTWVGALLARPTTNVPKLIAGFDAARLPPLHDPEYEAHTLRWLFERGVVGMSENARRVMAAAASLGYGPFAQEAIETLFVERPDPTALDALGELVRTAFLTRPHSLSTEWTFTHVLAFQFARESAVRPDDVRALTGWVHATLTAALREDELPRIQRIVQHAHAVLMTEWSPDQHRVASLLLYTAANRAIELGSMQAARSAVRAAGDWLSALRDTGQAGLSFEREQAVVHNRLGDLARATGDLAAARVAYGAALTIAERLAAADPQNAEWQRDLSLSHSRLGDLARATGDLAAARTAYKAALTIRERLAAADPQNAQRQRDLSVSHTPLGDLACATGDLAAARTAYGAALTIAERLAAADPQNAEWQRDLSLSHNRLGDLARATGDLAAARAAYSVALTIGERLAAADPHNAEWQRDLSVSC